MIARFLSTRLCSSCTFFILKYSLVFEFLAWQLPIMSTHSWAHAAYFTSDPVHLFCLYPEFQLCGADLPYLFISMLSSTQNVISLVTHPSRLNRIYILFLFYWLPVTLFHYSTILNTVGELLPMAYIWPTACFCMACRLRTAFTLFKWLNKNQKKNISWREKLHEIPFHWHTFCLWLLLCTTTELSSWNRLALKV